MMEISEKEFSLLSRLIYQKFGIHLPDRKRTLLVSRLQKKLVLNGYTSFQEYYDSIISDRSQKSLVDLVNEISTNTTFFCREKPHFDFFQANILPGIEERLKRENRNDIKVWSAGCSTGEEPYMLAILMAEYFGNSYLKWDAGVLATDISHQSIERAQAGIFSAESLKPVPAQLTRKYFEKKRDGLWKVKQEVIDDVTFRRLNLMNGKFPLRKPFHVIFCRNVMIYFDEPTKVELIKKFCNLIEEGGYLILGHSESIGRKQSMFNYLQPSVYQKI